MPKHPKPWHRKLRNLWCVEIDGKQHNLGPGREAFRQYHQLMARPQPKTVTSESVVGLMDAFLSWCEKNRATATYEWYRSRLELFARRYPGLATRDLRPFHVQEWLDEMSVSSGTRRNYGRSVKRCLRWAKKLGHIDWNPFDDLELPPGGIREQTISQEEYHDLLSLTPDESFRDLMTATWETGCRPQESLRVEANSTGADSGISFVNSVAITAAGLRRLSPYDERTALYRSRLESQRADDAGWPGEQMRGGVAVEIFAPTCSTGMSSGGFLTSGSLHTNSHDSSHSPAGHRVHCCVRAGRIPAQRMSRSGGRGVSTAGDSLPRTAL